jgi:hypothetical protein
MNTETTITSGAAQLAAPDLTQRPPRSPRQRLGGYAYACPNDQRFLEFAGVDPEALKAELATKRCPNHVSSAEFGAKRTIFSVS